MLTLKEEEKLIQITFDLARKSAEQGFEPFGAVLVKNGEIVSFTQDKSIMYADPTSHAELVLISEYCRKYKLISLEGYSLYCNVEPCVMCSGAIHWAKISRVVFSVRQNNLQKISKGKDKPSCEQLINTGNKKIEVVGGVLEAEGIAVLKQYPFQSKQTKHEVYQKKKYGEKG
ncbi:MAG: nucleoside deaminase [Saprospiraceae bacterium]